MKHIIVSGCARGIGEAVTRILLENGYRVTGMSRTDGETVTAKFNSENFRYFRGDLANSKDRAELVKFALDSFGQIDGLVNVAGVAPKVRADLLEMTEESYDFVMGINTKGTLFLTQLVANKMKENEGENKGTIVNISSMSAYTSSTSRGEYCISKAGVSMLTKLFADRLAEYGITVNEVLPGIISTDMTSKVKDKYDNLIENGLLPIKRWGEPEDIARAVLTLCDGSLTYMTGQSLNIDGGFHIRRL